MRLALCQINVTVGDIAGNLERIRAAQRACEEAEAELVLYPELALTGYPPEDLLLREHFLADARAALEELAKDVGDAVAVVGFPERAEDVYNAAAVVWRGSVQAVYRKVHLPNYGVFDEQRYFKPGCDGALIELGEHRVGLTVCEDMWEPGAYEGARLHAGRTRARAAAARGAGAAAAALAGRGRGVRGACPRPRRLREEERLRARGAGALGGNRLGAGRVPGRGRTGGGPR